MLGAFARRGSHARDLGRFQSAPNVFDPCELEGLPAPVRRCFRTVLNGHQPMVATVTVDRLGMFNLSGAAEGWKSFTSTHRVATYRPRFDWDARIALIRASRCVCMTPTFLVKES